MPILPLPRGIQESSLPQAFGKVEHWPCKISAFSAPGASHSVSALTCPSKQNSFRKPPPRIIIHHVPGAPAWPGSGESFSKTWVQSLVGKIPWRRKWQPTPGFLPVEFHGQRSLAGYSPGSCKDLDTTECARIVNVI